MATTLRFLAGIGSRRNPPVPTMQDIVTDRYRGMMKAQMEAVTASMMELVSDIKGLSPDILYEALEPTLELAKAYCPVDTGALRDSGYLEKQSFVDQARVIMGFAKGGDPPYAVLVHEMVQNRHAPPTRAKFLQAALEEDMGNIYGRILEAYKLP